MRMKPVIDLKIFPDLNPNRKIKVYIFEYTTYTNYKKLYVIINLYVNSGISINNKIQYVVAMNMYVVNNYSEFMKISMSILFNCINRSILFASMPDFFGTYDRIFFRFSLMVSGSRGKVRC